MTLSQNSDKTVLVDGANGYIGTHVVYALCKSGFSVRALIRESAAGDAAGLLTAFGAKVIQGSIQASLDSNSIQEAFDGVDIVVHLIGSIAPKKGETLEQLHGGITQNLVRICQKSGVKKIVMVTALGTADGAASVYHRTKRLAEKAIESSGIDFIILRPSLVVGHLIGRRDSKLVKRYRDMINSGKKAVPLIGGGKNKLQPVYVQDLANAIVECVGADHAKLSKCHLEIAGDEVVTMRTLIEMLMQVEGKDLKVIDVPPAAMRVVAMMLEKLMDVPLVSIDQVTMSSHDNLAKTNDLKETLKIKPTPLNDALASYKNPEMLDRWTSALDSRQAEGMVNS